MAEARLSHNPLSFSCDVKNAQITQIVRGRKLIGNIGAQFATAQLHVENGDIGMMRAHQRNRFRYVAGSPRYLMAEIDKRFGQEISEHYVIFGNNNFHSKPF